MSSQAWEGLSPEQQRAEWERWNAWQQRIPSSGRHAAPQPMSPAPPWMPPPGLSAYPATPQPQPTPKTNLAAGIGLGAGILGLLFLPILFGPIALVCAAGGLDHSKKHAGVGHGASIGALVLGAINLFIALVVISAGLRG